MENTKMNDSIILVNDEDDEIGFCEKMEVHQKGQLHRAFSLFIVDSNLNVLIQKRAKNKYHSGGLWTNACCSHPRKGEDIERSIRKRVLEELGIDIMDSSSFVLTELGKFKYIKHFDGCTEYEIDHVFLLELPSNIELHPNAAEVEELNWVNIFDLGDRLLNNPDDMARFNVDEIANAIANGIEEVIPPSQEGQGGPNETPPAPPSSGGLPYPMPNYDLSYGATGDGVRWLQWYLNRLGYLDTPQEIDGIFGARTQAALENFQRDAGIRADGIAGRVTRAALIAALS